MVVQIWATRTGPRQPGFGVPRKRGCTALLPRASVEALVAGVENPWKGKMLKSPPIGHFSEFSRRARYPMGRSCVGAPLSHRTGTIGALLATAGAPPQTPH